MGGLSKASLKLRNLPRSLYWHREAIGLMRSLGMQIGMALVLESWAALFAAVQRPATAVRLLGASNAWRAAIGASLHEKDRLARDSQIAGLHRALSEEAFAEGWRKGQEMNLTDAIDVALEEAAGIPLVDSAEKTDSVHGG